MVNISQNLSLAILQSVKDTAHRFENSDGGKKGWSTLLEEIYSSLASNIPNIDGEVVTDLKEFILHDCGDSAGYSQYLRGPWRGAPPAIINEQGAAIRAWSIGTDESKAIRQERYVRANVSQAEEPASAPLEAPHQIMTSRHTAWFLERLRSLCIETAEERSGLRGETLTADWCRSPEHFHGLNAFLTPPDDVDPVHGEGLQSVRDFGSSTGPDAIRSGPTVSWRTMIDYIQFIRENSNWTTPSGLSYIERIDKSHDWLIEGNLTGLTAGREGLLVRFPDLLLHELFNTEQGEDLNDLSEAFSNVREGAVATDEQDIVDEPVTWAPVRYGRVRIVHEVVPGAPPGRTARWVCNSCGHHSPGNLNGWGWMACEGCSRPAGSGAVAGDVDKKKGQVRELLDFLEKQVEKSELSEGKYKDYAGILMEVFQGFGESGTVTNV